MSEQEILETKFVEAHSSWSTQYLEPNGFICELTIVSDSEKELFDKINITMQFLQGTGCRPFNKLIDSNHHENNKEESTIPVCPDHGKPMKTSKFGGWYCPEKIGTQPQTSEPIYCTHTVK